MIGKRDKFRGGSEKQWVLELRWCRAADCSWGGFQPLKHDRQQWTVVYVGSLAARMTTTGDGDGWNRQRTECSRKDTVSPDHAGIGKWAQPTWNWCVSETTASEGLAASVWCAHTEINVSVWRRRWAPTKVEEAGTQEALCVLCCHSRDTVWPATRPVNVTQSWTLNVWCCRAVVTQQNILTPYTTHDTA